jgi:hypothetical protein
MKNPDLYEVGLGSLFDIRYRDERNLVLVLWLRLRRHYHFFG